MFILWPIGIYPRDAILVQDRKINVKHHVNIINGKTTRLSQWDAEKSFWKFQHPFMIKTTLKKTRNQKEYPQSDKGR